jgi:hypothetical protein
MGEWLALIDRRYYRRNLFAGADRAPDVAEDQVLLVVDRPAPEPRLAGIDWTWLECVGIDRSTPFRGIAMMRSDRAGDAGTTPDIALYRPATACHKPV